MAREIADVERTLQQFAVASQVQAAVAELERLREIVSSDSDLAWGEMYYAIGEGDLAEMSKVASAMVRNSVQYLAK